MVDRLFMKSNVFNVVKVTSCDCFRKRLRIVNGEGEFYEVMSDNAR